LDFIFQGLVLRVKIKEFELKGLGFRGLGLRV
jgi:hypothetical protein